MPRALRPCAASYGVGLGSSVAAVLPTVVLVEPQLAENIGTAARAMMNFGLADLRLVAPRPEWPNERARTASSGADAILAGARVHRSVAEAVADHRVVYATSARPRSLAKRVTDARAVALELRAWAQAGTPVAVLFGPERTGLVNDDVALADALIEIPTHPEHPSLNLAQAVLLVAYEWFRAGGTEVAPAAPEPATRAHLMSFPHRLEVELDSCGFLAIPNMRAGMVHNLRALFARAAPTDQELRTLHGVLTELVTRRTGAE